MTPNSYKSGARPHSKTSHPHGLQLEGSAKGGARQVEGPFAGNGRILSRWANFRRSGNSFCTEQQNQRAQRPRVIHGTFPCS